MEDDAVSVLGKIGTNATLRYAVQVDWNFTKRIFKMLPLLSQLLTPASINAKISGRAHIVKTDIKDMTEIFMDAKSSANMLRENSTKYMM